MSGTEITLPVPSDPNLLTVGQETIDRLLAIGGITMTSGTLRLAYFTSRKSETITQLKAVVGGTAAGATPTLIRYGLYSVDASGNLTLVASTPNDTTLLTITTTPYPKAVSVPYAVQRGQRYAFGVLVVTGATAPSLLASAVVNSALASASPRRLGNLTGQADLPGSIPGGNISGTVNVIYGELIP